MIAVLTDPNDKEFVSWVKLALKNVGIPEEKLQIVPLTLRGFQAREYGNLVRSVDACLVDLDKGDRTTFMMIDASLAGNFDFWKRRYLEENLEYSPNELDSRLILLTRQHLHENDITQHFSDFYTSISLKSGLNDELARELGNVLKDILDSAAPRVFISYRSSQRDFARKVSSSLKNRGALTWFDEIQIQPGDSILSSINRGLSWCTHMVMIIDDTFFDSEWTQTEVESMLHKHLSRGYLPLTHPTGRPIIPLFLVDPESVPIPIMLKRIKGIDCRNQTLRKSMDQLWGAISSVIASTPWEMSILRARTKHRKVN